MLNLARIPRSRAFLIQSLIVVRGMRSLLAISIGLWPSFFIMYACRLVLTVASFSALWRFSRYCMDVFGRNGSLFMQVVCFIGYIDLLVNYYFWHFGF